MTRIVSRTPAWEVRELPEALIERLRRERGLPEIVARLLVARGHAEPEAVDRHLRPSLMALHDPALLPGMEDAAERVARAIRGEETILVHGDYDVDGVCGTSLLIRFLEHLGARMHWHIPNRFEHGYAFGDHSVEKALEVGATLLISVDNGTSSLETITELARRGIETIVTDHHEPPQGELPPATAIVNPKLEGSRYPFRELCGTAVAFKLAWSIARRLSGGEKVRDDLRELLLDAMSYVAIATVCDVVPLVDENRVLARFGLQALEATSHPGLQALLRVAGLAGRRLRGEDLGFQVGPRLNASGRLGSARTAVELLMCDDPVRALALANRLDELNRTRKEIEGELAELALAAAEPFTDPERYPVTVVAGEEWHQGVIGIVASRLVGKLGRPAVVISVDGEVGKGSARSIPGVSILELLHAASDLLPQYGGHAQAAGLEVSASRIDELRERLAEAARRSLPDGLPEPPLVIDGELPFELMGGELMTHLDRLEPFGEQNEAPILFSRDLRLATPPRVVGADRSHLQLQLRRGDRVLKGMAFGQASREHELRMGAPIDAVYSPSWNTFRGETNLEVLVHDFRVGPLR